MIVDTKISETGVKFYLKVDVCRCIITCNVENKESQMLCCTKSKLKKTTITLVNCK
jgi:hypothetical protein